MIRVLENEFKKRNPDFISQGFFLGFKPD